MKSILEQETTPLVNESTKNVALSGLAKKIINAYQNDFPLCSRPYKEIADNLGTTETQVLDVLKNIEQSGVLGRIGAVMCTGRLGASTLAAMSVPDSEIKKVGSIINQFEEVNHNYVREDKTNIWFVAVARTHEDLDSAILGIEAQSGYKVIRLPMERSYHIDLGFNI